MSSSAVSVANKVEGALLDRGLLGEKFSEDA